MKQHISKMETTKTAVEWLQAEFNKWAEGRVFIPQDILQQAKKMEKEQRNKDYNAGYMDSQCNHINDSENYGNEQDYAR